MADVKVTALSELTTVDDADALLVSDVSASESKKALASTLREYVLPWERRARLAYHEDFLALFAGTMFAETVVGSGAAHDAMVLDGFPGIVRGTTGTTSSGEAGASAAMPVPFGAAIVEHSTLLVIETLATVGEDFDFQVGRYDAHGTFDALGVFFSYRRALRGANWFACCHDGASLTATDTGIAVVAGAPTRLAFVVNALGTSVAFYVNDVLRATVATNIPASCSTVGWSIKKTAGTTARRCMVDSISERITLTVSR